MKSIILALTLGASTCLVSAQDGQPGPNGQRPPPPPPPGGIHVLPRGAQEKLNLSSDQQKQVADLEADVKTKLEKILTPDQMTQLKQMRPPQGQRGPGGQGGPGDQAGPGQGGPGADGGPQNLGRPGGQGRPEGRGPPGGQRGPGAQGGSRRPPPEN